jgi:nucleoside diphosphate kinase
MKKFHEDLDKNHFEVFHKVKRILTQEEVLNLFYAHRNASYYPDILEHMVTAESIVMLLVNSCDKVENPEDPEGEEIKLDAPVKRWKALIGNKEPEAAKENPESLRGIYGKDIIMNAFHGADDPKAANKERDIFLFPIPERPPEFEFIRNKVSLDTIFKFLFPPNLEHANSTGRLDLFALYGPIVNYHSVDYCFCLGCLSLAKG